MTPCMTTKHRLEAALAGLAVAIAAIGSMGCPSNAETVESDVLELGTTVALTGDLAGTGKDNADAAKLAVDQINANGGVLGRPIRLIVEDDRTTVDGARAAFDRLVGRRVPVIIGPSSSSQVIGVADLIASSRTLTIGRTSTSPLITTLPDDDFFFRVAPSDTFQGRLLAKLIHEAGVQRLCIIHREDTYGEQLASVVTRELGPTVDIVRSSYNPANKDLSSVLPACNRLLCSQADGGISDAGAPCPADAQTGLLMLTYVSDGASILASANGWSASKQHFFFADGSRDNELVRLGLPGGLLEGARGTLPSGPDPASAEGAVLLAYQNAFLTRYGTPAPAFSETAFEAVYVAATAIELAGAASGEAARDAVRRLGDPAGTAVSAGDWKGIRDAIRTRRPIRYRGVTGDARFDENGDIEPPYYYRVWRIKNGASATEKIEKVTQ